MEKSIKSKIDKEIDRGFFTDCFEDCNGTYT